MPSVIKVLGPVLVVAATLATSMTVAAQPALATDPPVITGLQYTHGGTHQLRDLFIHGTNFGKATAVYFGATQAGLLHASNNRIYARSPYHSAGIVDVRVVTPAGESAVTPADRFTYRRPPKVLEVTPDTGDQSTKQTLTISGVRFRQVTRVTVGRISVTRFSMPQPNVVTAKLPSVGPGELKIEVFNKFGRWPGKPVTYTATHVSPPSEWTASELPRPSDSPPGQPWSMPEALDCADIADCAAVGGYRTTTPGGSNIELDWSHNGEWTSASGPLPDDASVGGETMEWISCGSAGHCVAVGSYEPNEVRGAGLIETLTDGTWTALRAPVPDSTPTGTAAELTDVDCTSDDICVAVGRTDDGLIIDTNASGTWQSEVAPLPAGVSGTVFYSSVSCGAPGACVVVAVINDAGVVTDVVDTLSGGTWTAAKLPLPANALATQPSGGQVGIRAVSCSAADFCAAVGAYQAQHRAPTGLVETMHGTQWTAAKAGPPVGTARANGLDIQLDNVSCAGTDTCLASGLMRKVNLGDTIPVTITLSNGTWETRRPTTPKNGRHQLKYEGDYRAVACGTSASCVYASDFVRAPMTVPLLNEYTDGSWTTAEGPFPDELGTNEEPTGAWCDASASCVVVGNFTELAPKHSYRGYVLTRINS